MEEKLVSYIKKYGDPAELEKSLQRLKAGEPVQYIVGTVDFYGREFIVNPSVLIPRFETEELVEKTIHYCRLLDMKHPKILDLGTGSGCIAITLAMEINDSEVTAVDISDAALAVAKENAKKNHIKIEFLKSDMLEKVSGKYDIIISNPPYIDPEESIDPLVRNNEPHIALFADNNGLYYYQQILCQAKNNLRFPSIIAFEIGETQGKRIIDMANYYFPTAEIKLEKDLQNRDRFIFVIQS